MGAKKITLQQSGKVVEVDLGKISIAEYRVAISTTTDTVESDKILCKSVKGLNLKELQGLPFPDYQQLVGFWMTTALDPLHDVKKIRLTEEEVDKYGVKYGQEVEIARPEEPDSPNSPSASTSE
jgi:hypothetical protein